MGGAPKVGQRGEVPQEVSLTCCPPSSTCAFAHHSYRCGSRHNDPSRVPTWSPRVGRVIVWNTCGIEALTLPVVSQRNTRNSRGCPACPLAPWGPKGWPRTYGEPRDVYTGVTVCSGLYSTCVPHQLKMAALALAFLIVVRTEDSLISKSANMENLFKQSHPGF